MRASSDIAGEGEIYLPAVFQRHGRIGRLRWLVYGCVLGLLPALALLLVAALADAAAMLAWGQLLCALAALVLGVLVGARRANDLGFSGWTALALLVPLVNLVFGLYLLLAPGKPRANRYGPAPAPNGRALVLLAWLIPTLLLAGFLAALALAPQKSSFERARDEMEQAA